MKLRLFSAIFTLVTTLFSVHSSEAQRYEYQLLSPIVSDNEEAIAAASDTWILFNDLSSTSPCPIAHNLITTKSYRLCDAGLAKAYAINRNGMVAGYARRKGHHQAAIWTPEKGLERIGFLNRADKISEAADLNDNGVVVGFSAEQKRKSIDFINSEGDSQHNEYSFISPQAFRWTRETGMRSVYSKNARFVSAGLKINARNRILTFRSETSISLKTDHDDYSYLDFGRARICIKRPGNGSYCLRDANAGIDTYCLSGNPSCLHTSRTAFNSNDTIVNDNVVYEHGRSATRSLNNRFFCDRCDYGSNIAISEKGSIASGLVGRSFLESSPGVIVGLTCLAPLNRTISNSNRPVQNIDNAGTIGSFTKDGTLLFSADILSDGRSSQLILLKPLSRASWGRHLDFCPDFTSDTETNSNGSLKVSFYFTSPGDNYTGEEVLLSAQETFYDADYNSHSCPIQSVDQTQISASQSGTFTITHPDDRFDYMIKLKSNAFNATYTAVPGDGSSQQCHEYHP